MDKQISFRLSEEAFYKLKEKLAKERMTLRAFMEIALEKFLKTKGRKGGK